MARLQQRAVDYAVDRPLLARLWRTAARYVEVRVARLAAFVTYYGFMALFPLTALAVSIVGILSRYLPALDDAVVGALDDNVDRLGLDPQLPDQLQRAAVGLGLISLGFLVYAGVRWIEALREAMALAFGGEPPRGRIVGRVLADLVLLFLHRRVAAGDGRLVDRHRHVGGLVGRPARPVGLRGPVAARGGGGDLLAGERRADRADHGAARRPAGRAGDCSWRAPSSEGSGSRHCGWGRR